MNSTPTSFPPIPFMAGHNSALEWLAVVGILLALVGLYFLFKLIGGLPRFLRQQSNYVHPKRLPSAGAMRRRLYRVRAKLAKRQTLAALQDGQAGLVLAGGGAKGAYQIGALRALKACGIDRFSAVAGTSVGALNGALVAQGDLKAAKRVWSNLGFDRVMRWRGWGRFSLAVMGRLLLAPMFALRNSAEIEARSEQIHGLFRNLTAGDGSAMIKYLAGALSRLVVVGGFIGVVSLIALLGMGGERLRQSRLMDLLTFQLLGPVAVLYTLAEIRLALVAAHDWLAENLSLFSNEPLQRLASQQLCVPRLRQRAVPTFVTLATEGWAVWLNRFISAANRKSGYVSPLTQEHGYCPIYTNLQELPEADVVDYVMQSAGLPEIFPRRVLAGQAVVDGGMADNWPLLPVLRLPEVEQVVVIYLDNEKPLAQRLRQEEDRLKQMAARFETEHAVLPDDLDELLEELVAHEVGIQPVTRKLLAIAPSLHPGGLLRGTMNFTRDKARRLMWLGYWDALGAMEKGLVDFRWWRQTTPLDSEKFSSATRPACKRQFDFEQA